MFTEYCVLYFGREVEDSKNKPTKKSVQIFVGGGGGVLNFATSYACCCYYIVFE
jgi:hypothetical protein